MWNRRYKLFFISFLILSIISISATVLFLPAYLDINRYKEIFEETAGKLLGGNVSIDRMDLSLKKGVEFVVKGFRFKKSTEGKTLLKAKKIYINFKILPIIKNRMLIIRSLLVDSPYLSLERGKNGEWFGEPLQDTKDDVGFKIPQSLAPGIENILFGHRFKIHEGRLDYVDKHSRQPVDVRFNGIELSVIPSRFSESIELSITSDIQDRGKKGVLKFDGKIINLTKDLKNAAVEGNLIMESIPSTLFTPYIRKYLPLKDLKTVFNVKTNFNVNMNGSYHLRGNLKAMSIPTSTGKIIVDPDKPHHIAFIYDLSGNLDSLKFKKIEIKTDIISIQGKGEVNNLINHNPIISFKAQSSEFDINKAKQYLLPDFLKDSFSDSYKNLIPENIVKTITSHVTGGVLQLKDIGFSGNWSQLTEIANPKNFSRLNGVVRMQSIGLTDIGTYKDIKKLEGLLTLKDGTVSFSGISMVYKDCKLERLSGSMYNLMSSPNFDINLAANLDLYQAKDLAVILLPPQIGSQIKKPKGDAFIEAKLAGQLDGTESLSIKGNINFKDASFIYGDIRVPFTDFKGNISFTDDKVVTDGLQWKMGESPFGLNGTIDIFEPRNFFNLNVKTSFSGDERELFEFLNLKNFLKLDGTWDGSLLLKGEIGDFNISGDIDFTGISYMYGEWLLKEKGVANKIFFNGTLSDNDISFSSFSVSLIESNITGEGKIFFTEPNTYEFRVKSDHIKMTDLSKFVKRLDQREAKGEVSLNGTFTGTEDDWQKTAIKGKMILKDVTLSINEIETPVKVLNASLDFIGDTVFFPSVTWKFDGGKSSAFGSLKGYKKPYLDFAVKTDELNLDHLFPPITKKEENQDNPKKVTPQNDYDGYKVKGVVKIDKGVYQNIPFNDLSMKFSFDEQLINMQSFYVKAFDGNLTGKGEIRKGGNPGFNLKIDIDKVDTKRIAEETFLKELKEIEGTGKISASLSGKGKTFADFKKTLKGKANIMLSNGIIYKFMIISKIFSLLNPSQLLKFRLPDLTSKGMPYNYVRASFNIKRGIAETKDFLIDSDSIRMTGIGKIMIKNNTIDMNIGVQPFQTIDKVVSNIPLVGRILTGKKKSLIVSYYLVKGDLMNPEVSAMPVLSVGRAVLGIFKRLFTLPVDLIK